MIKVELINKEYLKDNFFSNWGEFACECYDTPIDKATVVGKHCKSSGHTSGSRCEYFKFKISGISRSCSLQLNRHEVGVVKNQQSQRYCDMNNIGFVIPKKIRDNKVALAIMEDIIEQSKTAYKQIQTALIADGNKQEQANENARFVLLEACETKGTWAFTYEALLNFMHKRLCTRSQDEINELAKLMKQEVVSVLPELENDLVSSCEYLTWCPESKCCGKYSKKTLDKSNKV